MSKNELLLEQFTEYCANHPEDRFFQALRNWMERGYLLVSDGTDLGNGKYTECEDTFYWDDKDK